MVRCTACKSETLEKSFNSYFAQIDGRYVIIENVPCLKCEKCGEIFYSASTLEAIDLMLADFKKNGARLSIVEYKSAA